MFPRGFGASLLYTARLGRIWSVESLGSPVCRLRVFARKSVSGEIVRILIADDHETVRCGLRSLLESRKGWKICGEAVDGHDAIVQAKKLKPDVIVMDITMPNLNGLDATRQIRQQVPESEILIVSQHDPLQMLPVALEAGALGYVCKSEAARALLQAVETVGEHKPFAPATMSPFSALPTTKEPPKVESPSEPQNSQTVVLEATRALLSDPRLDSVLAALLRLAKQSIPADGYAVWRMQPDFGTWSAIASEGLSADYIKQRLAAGTMSTDTIVVPDMKTMPAIMEQRRSVYEAEGIRALIAAPLRLRSGIGGTLAFYFRAPHTPGDSELQLIYTLSNLAALAIETAEGYEAKEREKRRSQFLAEASTILASSLDYQQTLSSLAKIAVPQIADWCAIDVLDDAGELQRLCVEHPDPAKIEVALEIHRRFPPRADSPVLKVLQTRESLFFPEITDEMLARIEEPERLALLKQLGLRSAIMVPLIAHGRSLGVVTLVMAESGRRFRDSDRLFAEDLAQRAALAIDNARLHSSLRHSEENMRFSLDAANFGTWQWDMLTGQVKWSENMERIHGQAPGTFDGTFEGFVRGVHPEDREDLRNTIQKCVESGEPYRAQYRQLRSDGTVGWMEANGILLSDQHGRPIRMIGVCTDITERKRKDEELNAVRNELEKRVVDRTADLQRAENALRALSGRLLQMQDEERRRIARELHDSAGQILAALKMSLFPVQQRIVEVDPSCLGAMNESLSLVDELTKELRTISHLLHPPLLDELGLPSAIQWYVEGFAERSKVRVTLELPENLGRLSRELETTLFRIVQECLTNIHRHSGSSTAQIRVDHTPEQIKLEVRDQGKGFPIEISTMSTTPVRPGVGIQGMRERVRQLRGEFDIQSGNEGTVVTVVLPLQSVPNERAVLSVH